MLGEIQNIKGRIRATLAKALGNGNIQLLLRLSKVEEVKVLLSRREVLEEMKKTNPGVKMLLDSLELEMA